MISNKELEEAKAEIKFGWHSALALAGFFKWRKQNSNNASKQISVCLFTD